MSANNDLAAWVLAQLISHLPMPADINPATFAGDFAEAYTIYISGNGDGAEMLRAHILQPGRERIKQAVFAFRPSSPRPEVKPSNHLIPSLPPPPSEDEVKALIQKIVDAGEDGLQRDNAMRELFAALALINQQALLRYKPIICKQFKISNKDFERLYHTAHSASTEHDDRLAYVKDGRLFYSGELLCNFNAVITHEFEVSDGNGEMVVMYRIAVFRSTHEALGTVDIPAEEFESLKWLSRRFGSQVRTRISPSRRWLVPQAIQEVSDGLTTRESVHAYMGWTTIRGKRAFLGSNGAITEEGFDQTARVDVKDSLNMYSLTAPIANPQEAICESLSFLDLATPLVTYPLWCAMYAAPLASISPTYRLDALMWLYGHSGERKSTVAHLFLTHFGQGFIAGRKMFSVANFESTVAAVEYQMFTAKDLPLIVDDYKPSAVATQQNDAKKLADRIIRNVGNRAARGRSQSDLKMRKSRPPRCLAIATSEKPMSGGGFSTAGRMLYVIINKGDVKTFGEPSPLDIAQQRNGVGGPGLANIAMSNYIHWLIRNYDEQLKLMEIDSQIATQSTRNIYEVGRLVDDYVPLFVGGRLALRYALSHKAITSTQYDKMSNGIAENLQSVLSTQQDIVRSESPARRMCEALVDLMAARRVVLIKRNHAVDDPPNIAIGASSIGWFEAEQPVIYLQTGIAISVVRDFFTRMGDGFDASPDMINREFESIGAVIEKDKEQIQISKWMGAQYRNARVIALDAKKIQSVYGVMLWN